MLNFVMKGKSPTPLLNINANHLRSGLSLTTVARIVGNEVREGFGRRRLVKVFRNEIWIGSSVTLELAGRSVQDQNGVGLFSLQRNMIIRKSDETVAYSTKEYLSTMEFVAVLVVLKEIKLALAIDDPPA